MKSTTVRLLDHFAVFATWTPAQRERHARRLRSMKKLRGVSGIIAHCKRLRSDNERYGEVNLDPENLR